MPDSSKDDLTKLICRFLNEIGIEVSFVPLERETFLPGILPPVRRNRLFIRYDVGKMDEISETFMGKLNCGRPIDS